MDVSELRKLEVDLGVGAVAALAEVRKVVQVGALKIKREMQSDATGHAHAPLFPFSITYDTKIGPTSVEAEIGPDKSRAQGALGNLLYFGSSNNGPVIDLTRPLRREAPIVADLAATIAAKALL
jgi:hypothetical protein